MPDYTVRIHITADDKEDAAEACESYYEGGTMPDGMGDVHMPDSVEVTGSGVTDDEEVKAEKLNELFHIVVAGGAFEKFISEFGPSQSYIYGDEGAPTKEELIVSLEQLFRKVL